MCGSLLSTHNIFVSMFFIDMRKPYHEPGNNFDVDNLVCKEPFEIFRSWFDAACKETLIIEPNAMALGTATL